jgi:multidrug efflux pump
MIGMVDWAAARARMVMAFIILSIAVGAFAYVSLPKEGEPDIEIPALFVSVPFPGISAEDSEALLVKPMETELSDLDGLKKMTSTAAENYAGVALEFEFGWDKTKIMADVREAMSNAEGQFPSGFEKYSINEINFSEFPIIIVNLTGDVPERTMARIAQDLQDQIEALDAVMEAGIAGNREEMVEVVIDPLRLEAYNVTAGELISVVQNNNMLIAAGEVESAQGTFSVKIPSSFDGPRDIYGLPVKTNGTRVVTLGDLADIRMTFEDRLGTARFNGEPTVALQVVKRKGFNLIDTASDVRRLVDEAQATWPDDLRAAVQVGTSNDQSRVVGSMVSQLEGSVLTAIALVMIVILASLGTRAALLVGFAIPTSFLLCFVLLAAMGVTISNIVMFGLILAVGMLVDGAIVVVEYADKRIQEGSGPMTAYVEASKRMFWPIVSSTATTLCAFLPMLFWPGVPGEFMGMLPVTLIFVLSASLVVALIYLPVMGGVTGRMSRMFGRTSDALRKALPWWGRAALVPPALYMVFLGAMQVLNPGYLFGGKPIGSGIVALLPGVALFLIGSFASSITLGAARIERKPRRIAAEGHEVGVHGWIHENTSTLDAATEKAMLVRSRDTLEQITGQRPTGHRAAHWDLSENTIRLVAELGFAYDSSMMADEDCYELVLDGTASGVVEIPVDWVRDDAVYLSFNRTPPARPYASPEQVRDIFIREFDAAFDEGGLCQLVMHPFVIGYRSRIWILEEILRHARARGPVWIASHDAVAQHVKDSCPVK